MTGKKNDQDNYEKVDYSLVPIDIIKRYLDYKIYGNAPSMTVAENKDYKLFIIIHDILNDKISIRSIYPRMITVMIEYGIKYLAQSLGYGLAKYNERGNWEKFDSDPERFLRATLRHLIAIILGDIYDGEGIEGYSKGLDHRGAVCFNLMVVDNILKKRVD